MKFRLILVVLAVAIRLHATDAPPLFNATLTVGKEHRFVLIDGNGKASSFLSLGESFAGYTLKAYDAKAGALDLERDGKISRVALVADAATIGAPAAAIPATVADAEGVLNKMHFDEMMDKALDRQRKAIAGQFQQVAAKITAQGVEPAEAAAFQKKMADEVLGALDGKVLKKDFAKIYSEVFSKQELDRIAAFYSTPLGEMLAAKQPEVQDKFSAVMLTRMAEVMPKVQQMGMEFAKAQKAKREAGGGAPGAPVAPKTVPAPKPKP
ncbi:MAG: DUF2059 domain-containing protein [Opitutus sp.]|nr:DUF2059 domain-containing protein [Opitutus sp.]